MLVRLGTSVFIFMFLLLAGVGAHAQTSGTTGVAVDSSGTPTLTESIVVTATGKEESISTVGASITVVTHEQIEQRHALDMIDLLRTVPGIVAVRTGGIGNLTSLFVRGGESSTTRCCSTASR